MGKIVLPGGLVFELAELVKELIKQDLHARVDYVNGDWVIEVRTMF
jgi:hypothetical protein